ncbi:unnamed protein product, partial [Ixodes pacificus]
VGGRKSAECSIRYHISRPGLALLEKQREPPGRRDAVRGGPERRTSSGKRKKKGTPTSRSQMLSVRHTYGGHALVLPFQFQLKIVRVWKSILLVLSLRFGTTRTLQRCQ